MNKVKVLQYPEKNTAEFVNKVITSSQAEEEAAAPAGSTVTISNIKIIQSNRLIITYTVTIETEEEESEDNSVNTLQSQSETPTYVNDTDQTTCMVVIDTEETDGSKTVVFKNSNSQEVTAYTNEQHPISTPGLFQYAVGVGEYTFTINSVPGNEVLYTGSVSVTNSDIGDSFKIVEISED
jgi:hypothetical protein